MSVFTLDGGESNHHKKGFSALFVILFILHLLTLNEASNYALFFNINSFSAYLPSTLQALVTEFGSGIVLGAVVLCYLVKRPELICRVLLASILSLVFVPLLKQYFDAPRPAAIVEYLNVIGDARYKNSFPSGHTATAFLFAGLMFLSNQNKILKYSLLFLASLVGISRILVGAHWPADVVMGAIVGLSCAYAATYLCPLIKLSFRKRLLSYLLLLIALVTSELQTGYDFPDIPLVQYVRWGLLALSGLAILHFTVSKLIGTEMLAGKKLSSL